MSLPLLIQWAGHAMGAVVFGIFAVLLWRDRSGARVAGWSKALVAAVLAGVFHLGELAVLTMGPWPVVASLSGAAFSLLPAVLLDLVFHRAARLGYLLSAAAALLHVLELWRGSERLHSLALQVIALGFAVLSVGASMRLGWRRLPAALALSLFALSFLHFGTDEQHAAWWMELFVHHAGIPLAMFVLLQDYRSVLLDAFVRFLVHILWAAGFGWLAVTSQHWVLAAAMIVVYAWSRRRLEEALTRAVFSRPPYEALLEELREEEEPLDLAAARVAAFFRAPLLEAPVSDLPTAGPFLTAARPECADLRETYGVEAVLPVRVSPEEIRFLLFGRREGGRRYLSDDLRALATVGALLAEQMERWREAEMRRLVSQAELRALQSQIHPHFLFNAFNTLYGVIPRESSEARRMVLNLADIFRYFLQGEQTYVTLEAELRIIRAYLEIESLRLGEKLHTVIEVSDDALAARIPLLSVQPLVENAVKHGIAARGEGGTVRLTAARTGARVRIEVSDTGAGMGSRSTTTGGGVGLDNVRRRLKLCYGESGRLNLESSTAGTRVGFEVTV